MEEPIREMLNNVRRFNPKYVDIMLSEMIKTYSNDGYHEMLELARHMQLFQKKCHKLAWTLLNTINNVHHYHTWHNDISPNNVLLRFLQNSLDKGYIHICGWTIVGNFCDLKESLYIHKREKEKSKTI